MIDRFVANYSSRKHSLLDSTYTAQDAVVDRRLINPDRSRLTVLFPPWHGANKPFQYLEKRLDRAGSAVLSISLHGQILTADQHNVLDSFRHIQQVVADDLSKLVGTYGYSDIHLVGMSIGTVSMAMTSQAFRDYTRATFVVGASRLAPCVWTGMRTQAIRKAFEARGTTLPQLEVAWHDLSPSLSAPLMQDKAVSLVLSENDTVIPTVYQEELAHDMKTYVPDLTIQRKKSGHTASIVAFCAAGAL